MSTPETPREPDNLETLLGIDRADPVQDLACRLVEADTHLLRALVAMRRTKAIPEADVALRMGTTVYAVHVLERDDADPKLSTLRRYALAIGALVEHHVSPAAPVAPAAEDPAPHTHTDDCMCEADPDVTLLVWECRWCGRFDEGPCEKRCQVAEDPAPREPRVWQEGDDEPDDTVRALAQAEGARLPFLVRAGRGGWFFTTVATSTTDGLGLPWRKALTAATTPLAEVLSSALPAPGGKQ